MLAAAEPEPQRERPITLIWTGPCLAAVTPRSARARLRAVVPRFDVCGRRDAAEFSENARSIIRLAATPRDDLPTHVARNKKTW